MKAMLRNEKNVGCVFLFPCSLSLLWVISVLPPFVCRCYRLIRTGLFYTSESCANSAMSIRFRSRTEYFSTSSISLWVQGSDAFGQLALMHTALSQETRTVALRTADCAGAARQSTTASSSVGPAPSLIGQRYPCPSKEMLKGKPKCCPGLSSVHPDLKMLGAQVSAGRGWRAGRIRVL